MEIKNIKLLDFTLRHFGRKGAGTKILKYSPEEFGKILNESVESFLRHDDSLSFLSNGCTSVKIFDGEFSFSKILVMNNWTESRIGSMKIEPSIYPFIRHGYSSRVDKELKVLSRWIELPSPFRVPVAKNLIVILYSIEQLNEEAMAGWKSRKKEFFEELEKKGERVSGIKFPELQPKSITDGDWGMTLV